MGNLRISELGVITVLADNDLFEVSDESGGNYISKKITAGNMKSYFGAYNHDLLSADHGGPEAPGYLNEHKINGDYVTAKQWDELDVVSKVKAELDIVKEAGHSLPQESAEQTAKYLSGHN